MQFAKPAGFGDISLEGDAASRASLPELVYRGLRAAILNGVFAPGQMLRQEDVASRLGVSRSPLREALPRLEAEGVVVLHPRRGYAVASLDPEGIGEAFSLRALLEGELAARAITKRTEAHIATVYSILSKMALLMPHATDTDQADRSLWFELNTQFHDALHAAASSTHHMRALGYTRGLIEAYIRMEVRLTGDLQQAQEEHSQMARAFVAGDAETFVRLTREHSEHTRARLLAGLDRCVN